MTALLPREDPTFVSARMQAVRFWWRANACCWGAVAVFALFAALSDKPAERWAFVFFVGLALLFAVTMTIGVWQTGWAWRRVGRLAPVESYPGVGLGPTGGTPNEHTVKMISGMSPADPGALYLHVTIPWSMGALPVKGAVTVQTFGRNRAGEVKDPFLVVSADGSTRWWADTHHVSRLRRPVRAAPSSYPV